MNDDRRSDEILRSWVRSGPEQASSEFVERTLRPIPRMRQRRSWRIALERVSRPLMATAAVAATIALLVIGIAGFFGMRGVGAPMPMPSSAPSKPSFELRVAGGPGTGTYTTDPATSLNLCTHAADGSWRYLYAGGDPFVNLDVLIGPRAGQPDGASDVAAEIYAGPGYVRFDPAIMRGGDPPGRSTASVEVQSAASTTTFVIHATTPDRTTGEDVNSVDIDLTVTCPN
jgi:hypothetical protein